MRRISILGLVALSCFAASTPLVRAATLKVNCDHHQTISHALKVVTASNPQGPNTIEVSGTCRENVSVQSLSRVTLAAKNGASISDVTGGQASVVGIVDSQSITVQGFTIEGGSNGVLCAYASVCYLDSNTIQKASGSGVNVTHSSAAFLSSNVVKNSNALGMSINFDSRALSFGDIFQENTGSAVRVLASYFLCQGSTILNNGSDGSPGIIGLEGARLRFGRCTISNNLGDGVELLDGTEGRVIDGNVITANAGNGVTLGDLSFARFAGVEPFNNITGNLSGTDVACTPQFSATRGALTNIGGGITNCIEP